MPERSPRGGGRCSERDHHSAPTWSAACSGRSPSRLRASHSPRGHLRRGAPRGRGRGDRQDPQEAGGGRAPVGDRRRVPPRLVALRLPRPPRRLQLVQLDHGIQFHGVQTKAETIALTGRVAWPAVHPMVEHYRFLKAHTRLVPKMTIRARASSISAPATTRSRASIQTSTPSSTTAPRPGRTPSGPSTRPAAATSSSTTRSGPISATRRSSSRRRRAATTCRGCRSAMRGRSTGRFRPSPPT